MQGINLTSREKDVMYLVAQGYSNQEIADKLSLSTHTVKKYLYIIYKKLDVTNRIQAILQMRNLPDTTHAI